MATTKVEAALSVTSKDDSDEEFTALKPAANDSSSLEDGKVKTAPATSKATSSDEDSDEDSEDDKPPQKKAKADTRQSSSDDSSDNESDGEANKKAMPPSSTGGTKTLFMGNLASNVEKSDIEKFFETAGRVVDVRLVTSKKDGSFMNYGYAEFSSSEEAQKALVEFQRKELLGRKIRLDVSVDMGPDGRVLRTPDSTFTGGFDWPPFWLRKQD
ncbi:unnamed protein product [Arabidopsis lyrata]|nr:unnamed protein product [Arabidopsis lyrata]